MKSENNKRTPIGFTFAGLLTSENNKHAEIEHTKKTNVFFDQMCKAFAQYAKEEIAGDYGGLKYRIERFEKRIEAATLLFDTERKELMKSRPQFF